MNSISYKKISGQDNYQLKQNNETVLDITYNPETHIARVETNNERRALIIENEGLLRIKMVVKNEYGVRIGSLTYDNFSDTHGSVEIEDSRFRFIIQNEPRPELHICKGSRRNLIYNCQLVFDDISSRIKGSQTASLIIAVSWYLFLKDAVRLMPTFNEAIIL